MYVLKNHLNVFLYYKLNISFSSNYSNIFDNKNRNIKLIAFTKENKNKNKDWNMQRNNKVKYYAIIFINSTLIFKHFSSSISNNKTIFRN